MRIKQIMHRTQGTLTKRHLLLLLFRNLFLSLQIFFPLVLPLREKVKSEAEDAEWEMMIIANH